MNEWRDHWAKREAEKVATRKAAQAERRRVRGLIDEHGFHDALRMLVDGVETIGIGPQTDLMQEFRFMVQMAKRKWGDRARFRQPTVKQLKRSRKLAKLDALANDARGLAHERAVAKAMADKLRDRT